MDGAERFSTQQQQSGHVLRSGLDIRWRARETQMRDNPEGELHPTDDVRRCCNFFVLSCIDKKIKEGCDHGSDVRPVNSERDEEGPVLLRKSKESNR